MRTSYPGVRKSLGAGLTSIGTVLLLIAAMLVALEVPPAAAGVGPPDEGCQRIEGADVGEVLLLEFEDGVFVLINAWVLKPGETGEWIGFSWLANVGEAYGIVKAGSGSSPGSYEMGWGPAAAGSFMAPEGGAAISHIDVCWQEASEPGQFRITKYNVGGPETEFEFSGDLGEFSLTPPTDGTDSVFFDELEPGTYSVSEVIPDGFELTTITCTANAEATIDLEGASVEFQVIAGEYGNCNFVNAPPPPPATVTVVKIAPGADGLDFPFTIGGEPFALTVPDDPSATFTFEDLPIDPGVVEFVPDGWVLDDVSCEFIAGEPGPDPVYGENSAWFSLSSGDDVVCTFENRRLEDPTLRLTKEWVGDPITGDFLLFIDGSGMVPAVAWLAVEPGLHTIGETDVSATHSAGEWTCVDEAGAPFPVEGNEVTLDYEDDVTCTIVNTEHPDPILTLVKIWDGDGQPWPGFGLQVAPFGGGEAIAMTSTVPMELEPGTWVASELGEGGPGYVAGEWGGDCAADGTVVLAYGDEKICTIVNTDLPEPTLTVIKTWVDDVEPYGGFAMYASPDEGPDIPLTSGMMKIVEPGTYTVWETAPPSEAWIDTGWGGDCATDGTVTLDYEEHKVCTISNELLPSPELTLVKTWEGEPWDEFDLQVVAPPEFVQPMESGVAETFEPGDYTAMELGMPDDGYEAGDWGGDCDIDGDVVLEWGDSKTCTITNYEIPTIVLTKTVVGGDAEPDDFELRVVPADGAEPLPIAMLSGVEIEIEPGSYQAMETVLEKYLPDPWGGDCDEDGFFEIDWGDHLECTITNVDPLPKLTVTKIVLGGDAEPDDFDLTVTPVGGDPIPVLSGEKNDFEDGDYVVGETNLPGYAPGEWTGDCDAEGAVTLRPVTVETQDDLSCTITNIATTTTSTILNTTVTRGTTPTTEGGTTSTPTTIPDLPRTGGGGIGGVGYLPMLLGGLGLALLGAGLVLLAPRRQRLLVV